MFFQTIKDSVDKFVLISPISSFRREPIPPPATIAFVCHQAFTAQLPQSPADGTQSQLGGHTLMHFARRTIGTER